MRISDWSSDVCSSDVQFGRFNASIAAFQTDRPQSLNVPTAPGVTPSGTIFTVDGLQRNKGVEVSIDGEPIDGLRIIAGFAITDAKQRRTTDGLNDGRDAIGVTEYKIGRAHVCT